jgi:hypothetical protein
MVLGRGASQSRPVRHWEEVFLALVMPGELRRARLQAAQRHAGPCKHNRVRDRVIVRRWREAWTAK